MELSKHKNRAALSALIEAHRKRFSAKVCLGVGGKCSGGIISAHTLSASAVLKLMAQDCHVYAVKHLPWPFVATGTQNLTDSLELVPEEGLEPPTY
jgi:hypothetical protein